ncbi:MAG TPA: KGG domain-containing protein [Chloroflexota bacterium]|nr:KGG domain-containing protein [Chloroflexota bacterium]
MATAEHSSPRKRGFAAMDNKKLRDIASMGGKAAHVKGTAHEFTSQEARTAGRKGGQVVSQNREHMAEIGRRGGEESGAGRRRRRGTTA